MIAELAREAGGDIALLGRRGLVIDASAQKSTLRFAQPVQQPAARIARSLCNTDFA